jgi:hypothetical protein
MFKVKMIVEKDPAFDLGQGYNAHAEFDLHWEATTSDAMEMLREVLTLAGYSVTGEDFIRYGEQYNFDHNIGQTEEEDY